MNCKLHNIQTITHTIITVENFYKQLLNEVTARDKKEVVCPYLLVLHFHHFQQEPEDLPALFSYFIPLTPGISHLVVYDQVVFNEGIEPCIEGVGVYRLTKVQVTPRAIFKKEMEYVPRPC